MQNDAPIGFFDSGVGGLSVYSYFRKVLPCENTIYYGDLKNLPYGNKTQKELIGFARNILIWAKLPNFDPESSQGNGNMSGYFERFSVPATKSIGGGLKITF